LKTLPKATFRRFGRPSAQIQFQSARSDLKQSDRQHQQTERAVARPQARKQHNIAFISGQLAHDKH